MSELDELKYNLCESVEAVKSIRNKTLDLFVAELEKVIDGREKAGGHPVIVRDDLYKTAQRLKGEG